MSVIELPLTSFKAPAGTVARSTVSQRSVTVVAVFAVARACTIALHEPPPDSLTSSATIVVPDRVPRTSTQSLLATMSARVELF